MVARSLHSDSRKSRTCGILNPQVREGKFLELFLHRFLLEHPANIVINKDLVKSHDLLVPLD